MQSSNYTEFVHYLSLLFHFVFCGYSWCPFVGFSPLILKLTKSIDHYLSRNSSLSHCSFCKRMQTQPYV